jgi:hypothetical protein
MKPVLKNSGLRQKGSLFMIAVLAFGALYLAGGSIPNVLADDREALDPKVKLESGRDAHISDISYATYDVDFDFGGAPHELTYKVAYVMQNGMPMILECDVVCDLNVELTSWNIPERVKDHLVMSSISPIIGTRRTFVVGEKYESEFRESNGSRPLFRYTCTGQSAIGGINGYSLQVMDALRNRHELDLVISPDFPFPLMVHERVGSDPIQITLRSTESFDAAAIDVERDNL